MERVKITVEFLLNASPMLLYEFFTSPSLLVRWFCDGVDIGKDKIYIFSWGGYGERAKMIEDVEGELVCYAWLDEGRGGEYLEFKMTEAAMTSEVMLEITDFCDADEVDQQRALWESQIGQLKKGAGLG